jgi:hypothetical protein
MRTTRVDEIDMGTTRVDEIYMRTTWNVGGRL